MRVICINDTDNNRFVEKQDGISIGNKYIVSSIYDGYIVNPVDSRLPEVSIKLYIIKNDFGKNMRYNSNMFIKIDEYRDDQLEKLGI